MPKFTKIWNLLTSTQCLPSSWKHVVISPSQQWMFRKHMVIIMDHGINITPVIARAFDHEKIGHHCYAHKTTESNLSTSRFAYRKGGNCTNALLTIQHRINSYLDNLHCKAVHLFAMDFSKAFDSVKHELLANKLKKLPLNTYITNWYLNGLKDRKQRVCSINFECDWKPVNKRTTHGSISGPYLFNILLDDLNITLGNHDALLK